MSGRAAISAKLGAGGLSVGTRAWSGADDVAARADLERQLTARGCGRFVGVSGAGGGKREGNAEQKRSLHGVLEQQAGP